MIINYSHPLAPIVFEQLKELGYGNQKEHRISVQLDFGMRVVPQVDDLAIEGLKLALDRPAGEPVFLVLPGYSLAAALLFYRLVQYYGVVWFKLLHLVLRDGVWQVGEILGSESLTVPEEIERMWQESATINSVL